MVVFLVLLKSVGEKIVFYFENSKKRKEKRAMKKIVIPFSLLFYVDFKKATKRLSDIDTQTLISLYGKEGNWRVRQAIVPELTKRLSGKNVDIF